MNATLATFSDAEIDAESHRRFHEQYERERPDRERDTDAKARVALRAAYAALGPFVPNSADTFDEAEVASRVFKAAAVIERDVENPMLVLCTAFLRWNDEEGLDDDTHPHSIGGSRLLALCRVACAMHSYECATTLLDVEWDLFGEGAIELGALARKEQERRAEWYARRAAEKESVAAAVPAASHHPEEKQ